MATSMTDHRTPYHPVLSTTANYHDFENDQANIRAGRRTQQAISNRHRWQTYLTTAAHKRSRLSPSEEDIHQVNEKSEHNPVALARNNRYSLPVRLARRLANIHDDSSYDPDTIPVLSKREQRRFEKREKRQYEKIEKRKLDELAAQRRRQYYDQISRQLEVNERERQSNLPQPPVRRSVKDKVKDTIKKSTKIRRSRSQPIATPPTNLSNTPEYIPHIDDFESKSQIRSWFGPSDVEAPPPPPVTTIPEQPCAELPAVSISPPYDFRSDAGKRLSDDGIDLDTLSPPPPIRSPSPCLSSIPRRGITVSETPQPLSNKQMQCDYCHDAIKLAGFHYACTVCDDGDRLYCNKCVNDGRTCRHELTERTRNIKRHPTNPQLSNHVERRSHSVSRGSAMIADVHAELSAYSPSTEVPQSSLPSASKADEASSTNVETAAEKQSTPNSPTDVFRELETKRREQEITFREKEVTLREREAALREREAWTASRERDAALVQQLHAAAMLQRERSTEVGAQFMSIPSRHSSSSSHFACNENSKHRRSESFSKMNLPYPSTPLSSCSVYHHSPCGPQEEKIKLHSSAKGRKPNIELTSTVVALEASVAGIETIVPDTRTHANASKRKASATESKTPDKNSSSKRQASSRRCPPKKNVQNNEDENDESDASDGGAPKRQKQDQEKQKNKKLFACPYFKFEPLRYAEGNTHELNYRGCAGGLFRDISRVKQHLKRVHHRPDFYCQRCFSVFNANDKLQKHMSSEEGCCAETCPFPEKLDEMQQNRIHVKRPGREPVALWYDIFKIIFPGAPVPDSPYIESAEPKSNEQNVLEQFVRLFESKLDTCISTQPWLSFPDAREFLRAQMRQTMQETMKMASDRASKVPPVLVSPVSPGQVCDFSDGRQSSRSSRASSSLPAEGELSQQEPLLSPISSIPSLRPALKVKIQDTPSASSSSGSSLHSAKSQNSSRFPKVPSHVREDVEGNTASSSWQSGDDMPLMGDQMQEPVSATSTRSGKSVSFATPPQFVASWRENNDPVNVWNPNFQNNTFPPDLSYFSNMDWSAENFATRNYHLQPLPFKKPPTLADSGYGTLSSQPSRSSMFQQQFSEQHHGQFHQATCVDPQMLFVNPSSASMNVPGISADLQAYLNRDSKSGFGYQ